MKLFFALIFLFFSSALFQVQAQVLIPGPVSEYDFNQFDWQAFSNTENVQKYIDFRNETFSDLGTDFIISGLNLDKLDLIRIEQELALYKRGIKTGLSGNDIAMAEEAISRHWESLNDIEAWIKGSAELGAVKNLEVTPLEIKRAEDYRKRAWELYKGDQEIIFNMVEKKDKALYEALGASDEAYAGFISPYVERYTAKIEGLAQVYYSSLESAYEGKAKFNTGNVDHLVNMYSDSLKIYNCFKDNFKGWSVGTHQRDLGEAIKDWHAHQGLLGMNSFIETYKNYKEEYGSRFSVTRSVANVFQFKEAPEEVRTRMIDFYRNDIFNNEKIKAAQDEVSLRARVNALIGLNYMNALNEEERRIFNKAIEQGIISNPNKNPNSFFGFSRPLPP